MDCMHLGMTVIKASSFVGNFAIWIADTFMYIMNCPNNYIYYCIFNMKV